MPAGKVGPAGGGRGERGGRKRIGCGRGQESRWAREEAGGRQVRTVVGKRKAAERSGPQSAEIDDDWRRAQTRRAVAGHHLHVEGHHRIRSGGVWVTHSRPLQ